MNFLLANNNQMRTWRLPLIFLVGKIFSGIFCAFPKNHLLMVWVDKSFIIASEKPASHNVGFLRYIQAHCTKDWQIILNIITNYKYIHGNQIYLHTSSITKLHTPNGFEFCWKLGHWLVKTTCKVSYSIIDKRLLLGLDKSYKWCLNIL